MNDVEQSSEVARRRTWRDFAIEAVIVVFFLAAWAGIIYVFLGLGR